MNRKQAFFIIRFLAFIAVAYAILAIPVVDRTVVAPFTAAIASTAAGILRLFGDDVVTVGTALRSGPFAVEVKNGCNGVEAMLLLAGAMIAFPAAWSRRAAGALVGIVTIQVVNLVRVITLFLIARDRPAWFDAAHVTVWQTVMFLLAIGLFLLWSTRFAVDHQHAQ